MQINDSLNLFCLSLSYLFLIQIKWPIHCFSNVSFDSDVQIVTIQLPSEIFTARNLLRNGVFTKAVTSHALVPS